MKWERYQVLLNLSPYRSSLHWSDLLIILRRTIGRRTEIKKQKRNMKTSTIDPLDISSAIFGKRVNLSKVYFPAYKFISDSEPDDKDEDNFV